MKIYEVKNTHPLIIIKDIVWNNMEAQFKQNFCWTLMSVLYTDVQMDQ